MGGGGVCEVEGVASVVTHRELPDRSAELYHENNAKQGTRGKVVMSYSRSFRITHGFAGSPGEVYA